MSAAETDTYKCYAVNEYGKAVCTATLNVTEGKSCSLNAVLNMTVNICFDRACHGVLKSVSSHLSTSSMYVFNY